MKSNKKNAKFKTLTFQPASTTSNEDSTKSINIDLEFDEIEEDLLVAACEEAELKTTKTSEQKPGKYDHSTGLKKKRPKKKKEFDVSNVLKGDEPQVDRNLAKTWIYPTNVPIRDYQVSIVSNALLQNTLVCLPTGLGKTLIASVIMYNYYRWFPEGKVLFMAPTRPLVAQQIHACYKIVGIPEDDTVELTGSTQKLARKRLWKEKRVFFATPQIVTNDLADGTCPASSIVLVVFDEAHKAQKNYSYCTLIQYLSAVSNHYRVLALTATPGTSLHSIQQLIKNLQIAHVEIKDEDDDDVKKYIYDKHVKLVTVELGDAISDLLHKYANLIQIPLKRLTANRVYTEEDPFKVTITSLLRARESFEKRMGISESLRHRINGDFAILLSMYQGWERLTIHGISPFYNYLLDKEQEARGEKWGVKVEIFTHKLFRELKRSTQKLIESGLYHPKLHQLEQIVLDHFKENELLNRETRVIIFAQYRDTVVQIVEKLSSFAPRIKIMQFVGQSSGRTKGLPQKEQENVLKQFREGGYNTLVSTSVGEEGLDIGDVDLIVCYDALSSPIRMVQRLGRTGRKRDGQAFILLTKGNEEGIYNRSLKKRKDIVNEIKEATSLKVPYSKRLLLYDNNNRMIPDDIEPQMKSENIKVLELVDDFGKKSRRKKKSEDHSIEHQYVKRHYGELPNENQSYIKDTISKLCKNESWLSDQSIASPFYIVEHSARTNLLMNTLQCCHYFAYEWNGEDPTLDLPNKPVLFKKTQTLETIDLEEKEEIQATPENDMETCDSTTPSKKRKFEENETENAYKRQKIDNMISQELFENQTEEGNSPMYVSSSDSEDLSDLSFSKPPPPKKKKKDELDEIFPSPQLYAFQRQVYPHWATFSVHYTTVPPCDLG